MSQDELVIAAPDDWHVHVRDGAMLHAVLPYTARDFGRAIIMPNLDPPVTTAAQAEAYRQRVIGALPPGTAGFTPLMTCYLTDATPAGDLIAGFTDGVFTAAKLYPAHATTNAAAGVTDILRLEPLFARMAAAGMPLLIHGEVTDHTVDIFDRETVFIDTVLEPLRRRVPGLRIVLEHITTQAAVDYVMDATDLAATITVHHLMLNRNALFDGGIRPHHYCLPVLKRERHRRALRKAATSGDPRFFLGTDSAPHTIAAKLAACGCAGLFTAPVALASYAQVFDEENARDRLEGFASRFGPAFYRLPVNSGTITLARTPQLVPGSITVGDQVVVPFRAGETIPWSRVPLALR